MKPILSARNIYKTYGQLNVLKGIDIDVYPKEIVSVVGPSGAGKTTLLHILGTLETADKGFDFELRIDNTEITGISSSKLAKFRNQFIGFIFQFHGLLPEFSVIENVCLPAFIRGEAKNKAKKRALDLLRTLNINQYASSKPRSLSGGEQQRVAVARSLINNPKLIFADEPSGNLDTANAEALHDLFFELRDQHDCSFIIVTHNEKLAARANKIVTLQDGRVQQ